MHHRGRPPVVRRAGRIYLSIYIYVYGYIEKPVSTHLHTISLYTHMLYKPIFTHISLYAHLFAAAPSRPSARRAESGAYLSIYLYLCIWIYRETCIYTYLSIYSYFI